MHEPGLIRALGLFAPLIAAAVLCFVNKPDRRAYAGALLGFLWNLPSLLLLHVLAVRFEWWRFEAEGGLLLGMPADLYLGWALLWGSVPALGFRQIHLAVVVGVMVSVDLLLMPVASPVIRLGEGWLVGEAVGLLLCLLPAQLLARWTCQDRSLAGRVLLQVVCFAGLSLGVLPAIIIQATDRSWLPFLERSAALNSLAPQLLALPGIVALSAVREFAQRGRGTPVPYDPPKRLVTSGVYAYVANPMQLAMPFVIAGWGLFLQSPWVVAAGFMSLVYSVGLAAWDEDAELAQRFGASWITYRRNVRRWCPRWRPYVAQAEGSGLAGARLYVAEGCTLCSEVGRWLERRRPGGLVIVAAEDHPSRDLVRLTYDPGDGSPAEEGVVALARGLEHLHLGWAFVGWTLRLPLMSHLSQVLVDALGGGPRLISRRQPDLGPGL